MTLSLDNLFAGVNLGILGFSPWFSHGVFGVMTAVLSLVGLQRACSESVSDLLSGAYRD